MTLPPSFLDAIRERTTLSALIQRSVKLQRAGNEWKACCPFHHEKTPSFYVNDAKGFYHCFGCEAHGDAIRWLTDQQGLGFMDAVKELAAAAGMEMPAPDPAEARRSEQRAGLHESMQAAQDWFSANLAADSRQSGAHAAREYLTSRGFDAHTIARFGFGFAPDDRNALKRALSGFDEAMLIEGGLRIAVDGKPPYDRFRNRLMLPICDARGRVIAFGGRILDTSGGDSPGNAPKYLNSPDTPLFDKGRTLYNLHRAGPAARKAGRIIVVEGYMDVIALAAAGIEEAVAPMGTALTEHQLGLLWRLVEKPILCFDGDAAGQRAAMRAITRALPLLRPAHSLRIARLPAGLDPDDLLRRDGREALEALFAAPQSMLDTIWQHELEAAPLASPEDKAGLKARLLAHVEMIADNDIRALYRRDLLDRFSAFAFPRREQRAQGGSAYGKGGENWGGTRGRSDRRRGWQAPPAPMPAEALDKLRQAGSGAFRQILARAVLTGLARFPDQIARHSEALLVLADAEPRVAEAAECLVTEAETLEGAAQSPISLRGILEPPPDGYRFSFLMEEYDPADAREDLAEAVTLLVERPALEAAIAAATARFDRDPEGAFAEQQRLRKRKLDIDARLGQMARKRAAGTDGDNNWAADASASTDIQRTD